MGGDLTGNEFVDFDDLAVLLSNWDQNVSALLGNLVDAANTPVNFDDLAVLLSAWTGPDLGGSPQQLLMDDVAQDGDTTRTDHDDRLRATHEVFDRRGRTGPFSPCQRRLFASQELAREFRAGADPGAIQASQRPGFEDPNR